jgi:hypothetical protein
MSSSGRDGLRKGLQAPHACSSVTARRKGSNQAIREDYVDGDASEEWRSELQGGAMVEIQVKDEEGEGRWEEVRNIVSHGGSKVATLACTPS